MKGSWTVMSHFKGSQWGGWPQEVPEERPVLVPTWIKTNLEGEVGSPGQWEWMLIRRCDSAGCTGWGSPGFTERCFFRGKVLTKAVSTHWAGSKQVLLPPGQSWRAVCSCYLLFWWWEWCTGTCALSLPAYATSTAVLQPALLSVALPVSSVLMATFEISCCWLCKVSAFHHHVFLCECRVESSVWI